ncbi:MAG: type II secretion system F family protein [Candidatus Micrarchaeia archaeon]
MLSNLKFEKLVSRQVTMFVSREIDLAGLKMSVEKFLRIAIVGAITLLVLLSIAMFEMKVIKPYAIVAFFTGVGGAAAYLLLLYMVLEYMIQKRKTKMEAVLPDFLQIASANLRSGIALDRALLLAARPEFEPITSDIKIMSRNIFGGENLEDALKKFATNYRSYQLTHAVRMMVEALRYGGAMADLIEQIAKDMRNQQLIQKEVSGQLFMYSIFIAFAGLIAAPVLYGLTSQMIVVTDTVWKGILASNPGGLPTTGLSFLRPSPPKITPQTYHNFSLAAIIIITGFAALIMSAISSGSVVNGLKYLPVFIIVGLVIFIIMHYVIGALFSTIGTGV